LNMLEKSNKGNEALSAMNLERIYKVFSHKSKQAVDRAIEQCTEERKFNSIEDLVVSLKRKLG